MSEDSRSPEAHGVDRILYSDAFRRLGGVTQVVAAGEVPLFHTRLTHTLKVQQLARRIAEHLLADAGLLEELKTIGGVSPDAAEAAGLAHDLGHPPFGHVGESQLNDLCEQAGLDGFEGNAQTFRILTKIEKHGRHQGLDLPPRILAAVVKYPRLRGTDRAHEKWNAYPTETDDFARARSGHAESIPSLEAMIMDWADDISYAVHDLEDFTRAGLIPLQSRLMSADESTRGFERAKVIAAAVPRLRKKPRYSTLTEAVASEALDRALDPFAGDLSDSSALRSICGLIIGHYVSQASVSANGPPLVVPPESQLEVDMLMRLTWHYVIDRPGLATLQEGHKRVIGGLFEGLADLLKDCKDGDAARLPEGLSYRYGLTKTEGGREYYVNDDMRRARAVADYISSLTESQAVDLFERLHGTGAPHSALDQWLGY